MRPIPLEQGWATLMALNAPFIPMQSISPHAAQDKTGIDRSIVALRREISFKNGRTRLHMNVPVQQRYLDTRRRYETIQEQCIAAARPFDPRDIEGFSKRLVTAERQLGYLQAYQEMKQAEQALVAWAQSLAQLEANQDLARLFQSYRYYPDIEARMIELCLSINVDDTRSS